MTLAAPLPALAEEPLYPRLDDVVDSLGSWIGTILPGVDAVLAGIGDGDWKGNTRAVVLQHVGVVITDLFVDGIYQEHLATDADHLERVATRHLAGYVVMKSLADERRVQILTEAPF